MSTFSFSVRKETRIVLRHRGAHDGKQNAERLSFPAFQDWPKIFFVVAQQAIIGIEFLADLCLRLAVNRVVDRSRIGRCRCTQKCNGYQKDRSDKSHNDFDSGACN
jgi:hypothetical protein